MQLDARQELILAFTFGGLFVAILVLYVAIRIKAHIARVDQKVTDLRSVATDGVSAANASLIRKDIKDMRTHMVSNHDEIDGELNPIREKTNWLAAMFDKYLKFEGDKPPMPKRRSQVPHLTTVKKDDIE